MKKYLFVVIFLCLLFCSFILLSYAQQAEQVEVTHSSGKVEVLLEGADEYTDAQDNMVLSAGDKIKTASGAFVELSFNEANTNLVRLDENTSVNISLAGDEKIEMTEGEVFSSISELPSGSVFEIRTPTAVSGARGTDWVTKVTEEGTDVEALESVPYVRHFESSGNLSKEIIRIVPGQMTTVRKFQKPMAFRPIEGMRKQKWQQVKKEVVQRGFEAVRKRQEMPPFNRKEFINQIKEKANFKRQDLREMKNEMKDNAGALFSGEKQKQLLKPEGDKPKPENYFKERLKENIGQKDKLLRENVEGRNPRMEDRSPRIEEKERRMEQIGQLDFNQRRNEVMDKSGVLVRDEHKSENDFRERGRELRGPRNEALREKAPGTLQQRPQSRKPSPQRIMKPGPGRR